MRKFKGKAIRSELGDKNEYVRFISPIVIQRYGDYMRKHQITESGEKREADNWRDGIDDKAYLDSCFRHYLEWWKNNDGYPSEDLEETLCAIMFNTMGRLHNLLEEKK